MALRIKTTGVEQYLPGGEANIKVMVIGGPGAGKTRWASYWPEPIYLNCEAGLASVADRSMPYVDIDSSEDMLDALKWLKRHPDARQYGTVVVDTLDSFQRKVKDEWLQANAKAEAFSGYDAWGYLDAKMQALMTRLLSLNKHVIVLVHYKDKTVSRKVGGSTIEETFFTLQLQGDIKDTAFNDFDLVGWMDTYFEAEEADGAIERVQKRGITFKPSPARPFLKDRLFITPEWLPVAFDVSDYTNLFERFTARLDDLGESGEVGEIQAMPDEDEISTEGVRKPERGGPVAPEDPREMPLKQSTKAELIKQARDMGLDVKTSMLKDELVQAIEKARAAKKEEEKAGSSEAAEASPEEGSSDSSSEADAASTDVGQEDSAEAPQAEAEEGPSEAEAAHEAVTKGLDATLVSEEKPDEDESTDEPEPEAETPDPEPAKPEPEPEPEKEAASEEGETCDECGKALSGETPDLVKLAYIKFRKNLCNDDYRKAKSAK